MCTRATGVKPSSRAFSDVVISSAAEPSEICDALPAVMTPSGVKAVLSPASVSTVVPGRMPSSCSTTVPSGRVNGAICASKRPSARAAAAFSCEATEYSSS